jgi:hypothetical protein
MKGGIMSIRKTVFSGFVLLAVGLASGDIAPRATRLQDPGETSVSIPAIGSASGLSKIRLPLIFEDNAGQAGGTARFIARSPDYLIGLEPSGAAVMLASPPAGASIALEIRLEGADPSSQMTAEEKSVGVSNYFIGSDPAAWRTNIPHYTRVRAQGVYPGIDLVYYGNQRELEFDFVVGPGADPRQVILGLEGVETLRIDRHGDLLAEVGQREFRFRRPIAYQGEKDGRQEVKSGFVLLGRNEAGFEVGAYDRTRPLVIDPSIAYATYFGSGTSTFESISGIAVDQAGCLFVQGTTAAANFPTINALYPTALGGYDVFVSKLNAAGDTLLFSTYFGGSDRDYAAGIVVDTDGDIYLTGSTASTNFPTVSPIQAVFGGSSGCTGDAFLTKMKGDGSALIYSTYLGGSLDDEAMGVSVDDAESAYVSGRAESANFPTANAYQGGNHGGMEVFISKVNAAGSAFVYSTYLGGSGNESGARIAATSDGYACVAGHTSSTDFPLVNAYQPTYGGQGANSIGDIFVTKFDPSGQSLVFSTYLGGNGDDMWPTVASGTDGAVYVTGDTSSTNFPTVNAYQAARAGSWDAFVTSFSSDGSSLIYSTYLGGSGSGHDDPYGIAVNALGNAYVAGITRSADFPTIDPIQAALSGESDGYISVFAADGKSLAFSTFLGGTGGDGLANPKLDADGNIYISGYASTGFPTTPGSLMPTSPGAGGGFCLAKIEGLSFVPGPTLTSLDPSSADAGDAGFSLVVHGSDFVDGAVVRWDGSDRTTTYVSAVELRAAIAAADMAAGKTVMVTVRNPDTGVSNALTFMVNNPTPSMGTISPTGLPGGGSAFALTVQGSNFVPSSVVSWNGSDRTTTYISATELQAAITASDLATPGEIQVTVVNPAPVGGTSTAAAFSVSGFTVASSPTSATVSAGQSATYSVSLTPQYGSFDSAVSLSCTGLPSKCTATFAPASVTPGVSAVTTTLTLATKSASASTTGALFSSMALLPPASGMVILILAFVFSPKLPQSFRGRTSGRWLVACALICLIIVICGCSSGGGGDNNQTYTGTPKGIHTITVNAVSGNLTITTPITLVVN